MEILDLLHEDPRAITLNAKNPFQIFGEELEDEQADLAVEIEELEIELEYLSSKEHRK